MVCTMLSGSAPGVHVKWAGETYCGVVSCGALGAVAADAPAGSAAAIATASAARMKRRSTS